MWKLFKEVFSHYRDEFIGIRKKKPWKENLFFMPLIVAFVVAIVILVIVILKFLFR